MTVISHVNHCEIDLNPSVSHLYNHLNLSFVLALSLTSGAMAMMYLVLDFVIVGYKIVYVTEGIPFYNGHRVEGVLLPWR